MMTALRESSGSPREKERETHVVSSATIPPPSGKTCTVKLSSGPRLSLAALTTPYRSQAKKLPDAVRRLTEDEPESWETTQTWAMSEGSYASAGEVDEEEELGVGGESRAAGTTRVL